jgi:hypothetical protein
MAEHAHNTPAVITRRRRKPPAQVGGVVVEQKLPADAQAIVAAVRDKSRQQSADLTKRMQETLVLMRQQHREQAEKLVPIGMQMDRPMLDDFIEIGRRMLAGRGMA